MVRRLRLYAVFCSALSLVVSSCATRTTLEIPGAEATFQAEVLSTGAVDLETQLSQYVVAQQALAADNFNDAKAALERLTKAAGSSTRFLVQAAARADDIETMRAQFKPLSEFLAAMDLPLGYARAYCPMYDGGSNWVQLDGPVRNPYYGSTMLTCGFVDAAPGAHMDHSPRHNGIVFMAPDSFHHIEGVYPEPGVFRVYATDNYREPVDITFWAGRAVLEEEYDEETDEFLEVVAFPLLPSPDGAYLEAKVGEIQAPAEFTAKILFVEDFPAERFDFIFAEYSDDDAGVAASLGSLIGSAPPESVPLTERIRPRIPELTSDIVGGIETRDREIQELITRGGFTEIFIPALQAKELALALHERAENLSLRSRNDVRIAIRSLVRAAWLLDWYGDLGNKQQVNDAYEIFEAAVGEIFRVYDGETVP